MNALPPTAHPAPAPATPTSLTRPIQFWHRGQLQQVQGLPATTSVLGWLREQQRCTGTKEGCNEGDCGACTVLVAELAPDGHTVQVKPLNSCIQFLPTLDGKALLTVEDLGGPGQPSAVQQALVAHHGSQCGFCTPGFAMSLTACQLRHAGGPAPTRQQLADDLSGNLCRCTGYRPILDAAQALFQGAAPATPPALDAAALRPALQALAQRPTLHCLDAQGQTRFIAPRSTDALAAERLARPGARLLAGGTDIGLWVNKQFRDLGPLLYLGEVAELRRLHSADGALHIGAGVSLEAAWPALALHWPELQRYGLRFASRPVREAGTLVGNLANGSPIGDGAPVLMALGAGLLLRRGDQHRRLPLDQFYLGYQRNALAEGEFIESVRVPLPTPPAAGHRQHFRADKLSKRFDSDISAVAAGLWLALDAQQRVAEARLAFGGLAATVQRARATEAALLGQPWTEASLHAAQAALAQDFQPLTDLRASAAYRLRGAQALLQRLWLATRADQPLPAEALNVWGVA